MRFLVDECTGTFVAQWLQQQGHEVFSVYDQVRGIEDETIIRKAFDENRILITNDKDFGEKIYRWQSKHHGVVFLRLEDERAVIKIKVMNELLKTYADQLPNQFVVVTESSVRFGGRK